MDDRKKIADWLAEDGTRLKWVFAGDSITDEVRGPHLPAYGDAVRAVAAECGSVLVDHFTHWQRTHEGNAKRQLDWLNDAIHPNHYGHRAMAHLLIRELGLWDEKSLVCRLPVPE